nr:U5 small nuclear ribonucleoprotein 40 kDa protein (U5-40K) [Euglena gracilis]
MKRTGPGDQQGEKRQRGEAGSLVVHQPADPKQGAVVPRGMERTSELMAPNVLLTGHEGEVFTAKFSPDGNSIASAGYDKRLFLWRTFGDCENYSMLLGHTNAILDLHWSADGSMIFSCGADRTVQVWDTTSLTRLKKIRGHDAIVNACCCTRRGNDMVASGADDASCKIWDMRAPRRAAAALAGTYPVTAIRFSDQNDQLFACNTAGTVQVWELRKNEVSYELQGHLDVITGCSVSPDGNHLLTNSMDNTMRAWDVRPYVRGGDSQRCVRVFAGHAHGVDKNLLKCAWSPSGELVSTGSADNPTHGYIFEFATGKVKYALPGHKATVNEVSFHPTEPIVISCSSDGTMYLGELGN